MQLCEFEEELFFPLLSVSVPLPASRAQNHLQVSVTTCGICMTLPRTWTFLEQSCSSERFPQSPGNTQSMQCSVHRKTPTQLVV